MKDDIKMLIFKVDTDGDFCWNCKTFPRNKDRFGDYDDWIIVYFKNPTRHDIQQAVGLIAKEFKESLKIIDDHLKNIVKKYCNEVCKYLLKSVELKDMMNDDYISCDFKYNGFANVRHTNGVYSMELKLINYLEQEISFANNDNKMILGTFNIAIEDLL
ncbi:hypothetical protein CWE04_11585 [Thomasclavelia cocleata]|uniref:Uncharacterized protein n=1 Tax=Thomasclavelia cocleata TaxID=69824 RepID=A0A1I0GDM2_9FIRM|nr:hypothetical protein [Thomasclavelia cocleata]MCR1959834.1 hypothetical protein [Thomasclavelia cocleata]NDO43184.1 hypothetical protein [Thomasclavelia cocleata]PJN79844.1 hypothetical protein CWE04_11585 [Thomasclavelia cocleata]SET68339.1 hypothetical protein SAMN04489758_1289 [Thomasclavelia cocleata]